MRLLLSLFFISQLVNCQEASQQEFKLKSSYKKEIKDFRKPLPTAFSISYEMDTVVNRFVSLSAVMTFKRSATIFDMTRIIFLKDGTFYCYTYGCLREGSSAGNFTIHNDTLTLTSSNKIFNKLKENPALKSCRFVFVDLKDLKFLIKNEELISIKQASL
jgi:cell division protein FtsI/penicillin-binding protein 2